MRKPRGVDDIPEHCLRRHGLCCSQCRRRQLPPSCLFDGRHVYLRSVLLLVVALRQTRPGSVTITHVCRKLGVARHTVRRWCRRFAEQFPVSATWQLLRGRVGAVVSDRRLPCDVFEWLGGGGSWTVRLLIEVSAFFGTGIVPDVVGVDEGW